jgi:Tfp pilus assembly protein PilV
MRSNRWRALRRRAQGDEGFGLVEAVVAAFVLLLFSVGIAGLITATLKVSKIDRMRVAASSLATREMEIVRNQFASSDADALAVVGAGLVTDPNPLDGPGPTVVDGVRYTVKRTASWVPKGTGVSACDGGGSVTYPSVRISVEVTWPGMGPVQPVRSDSIVTPNKGLLNTSYAFVAVKVTRFDGSPFAGRTITSTGPGGAVQQQLTDASGCAVFGFSAPGEHTFTLAEPGFVDYYNKAEHVQTRSVSAGSFQTFAVTYDQAASMAVAYSVAGGHGLPSPLPPLVVSSAGLPSPKRLTFASAGPTTTVSGLPPYAQGYTVWAGTCTDAEPAQPPTSATSTTYFPEPGQTLADVVAGLAPVEISTGSPGLQVTAAHDGEACPGMGTLTLGTTDANGQLLTSLPYGAWRITLSDGRTAPVVPAAGDVTVVGLP